MPKVAITVAMAYSYAAYEANNQDKSWGIFLAAAGSVLLVVPFTLVFMSRTNRALIGLADGSLNPAGVHAADLISSWGHLNAVRSVLPFIGSVLGVCGLLGY